MKIVRDSQAEKFPRGTREEGKIVPAKFPDTFFLERAWRPTSRMQVKKGLFRPVWGGKEEGMKRVCSWCNQDMDAGVVARSSTDQIITHGICEVCATDVLADIGAVELDVPERRPGSGLRRLDAQAKLRDWQRAG
jgi:hypothetical protein